MPIWQFLRRLLGRRFIHVNQPLLAGLDDLAERQQWPQEALAVELLARALEQQQNAEAQLDYWNMLTRREQDVTALACLGLTNAEIAARLSISVTTVSTHIHNTLGKLGLCSKAELRQFFSGLDFGEWMN